MDRKAHDAGLSVQQAKARLLAIAQQPRVAPSFITKNPLQTMFLAAATGFIVSRSVPLLTWAAQAGWSVARQFLTPQAPPPSSLLDRIRQRTYRRGRQ